MPGVGDVVLCGVARVEGAVGVTWALVMLVFQVPAAVLMLLKSWV